MKIACITLDMEPDHGDPDRRIRLFDAPGFLDRYVDIVQTHGVKVTMFTVTSLFAIYSEQFRGLENRIPLEYEVHSHVHDPRNACGLDEVEASLRAYEEFCGRRPLGYRSPIGQITPDGLRNLLSVDYPYDASIYPSYRPGATGYSNLDKPNVPFLITDGDKQLIEFPFTCISAVRIPFALSYAKLLGWVAYSTLLRVFSLPDTVLLLAHPHDFYFHLVAEHSHGLERRAMARNSDKAFVYFERMIEHLEQQGYQFAFLSELYERMRGRPELRSFSLADWN